MNPLNSNLIVNCLDNIGHSQGLYSGPECSNEHNARVLRCSSGSAPPVSLYKEFKDRQQSSGAVYVLWNFSRTQIASTSCDISVQKISRKNTIFSFIWLYFFKLSDHWNSFCINIFLEYLAFNQCTFLEEAIKNKFKC